MPSLHVSLQTYIFTPKVTAVCKTEQNTMQVSWTATEDRHAV